MVLVILVIFNSVLVEFDSVFEIVLVVLIVHGSSYFGCFLTAFWLDSTMFSILF